jgi:hypothetical protein
VRPEERTAVRGVNSALRTLAQSAGPSITGVLVGNDAFWVTLVVAGALKGSYNVGLWLWAMKIEPSRGMAGWRDGEGAEEGGRGGGSGWSRGGAREARREEGHFAIGLRF